MTKPYEFINIHGDVIEAWVTILYCFGEYSNYPPSTLSRRLEALTEKDCKKINKYVSKIDEVISNKAGKNKDPWP